MKPESQHSVDSESQRYLDQSHNPYPRQIRFLAFVVVLLIVVGLLTLAVRAAVLVIGSATEQAQEDEITSSEMIDKYGSEVQYTDPFGFTEGCDNWMATHDNGVIYCIDDLDSSHELVQGGKPFFLQGHEFSIPESDLEEAEIIKIEIDV